MKNEVWNESAIHIKKYDDVLLLDKQSRCHILRIKKIVFKKKLAVEYFKIYYKPL